MGSRTGWHSGYCIFNASPQPDEEVIIWTGWHTGYCIFNARFERTIRC